MNGKFLQRQDATISVFDSGFLLGDGVWEGIRYHKGKFLFLRRHLERLFWGAAQIDMDIGKSLGDVNLYFMKLLKLIGWRLEFM